MPLGPLPEVPANPDAVFKPARRFDRKTQKQGRACVIPYIDHVVWKLLEANWSVNVLDKCDAFDINLLPVGMNIVIGDVLDDALDDDDADCLPDTLTPLRRALDGCSIVYVLARLDIHWALSVDPQRLMAITAASVMSGVKDIRFVPPCSRRDVSEHLSDALSPWVDMASAETPSSETALTDYFELELDRFIEDDHASPTRAFPKKSLDS